MTRPCRRCHSATSSTRPLCKVCWRELSLARRGYYRLLRTTSSAKAVLGEVKLSFVHSWRPEMIAMVRSNRAYQLLVLEIPEIQWWVNKKD
jgi:predicted amidophosphoribosyltransferase